MPKAPTQVCDRPDLSRDLFLCILPQASQKVDDQVHGRFARLSEEIELPFFDGVTRGELTGS